MSLSYPASGANQLALPLYPSYTRPTRPVSFDLGDACPDRLRAALLDGWAEVRAYLTASPAFATVPARLAPVIAEMARRQRLDTKTTRRGREDCDRVNLTCRLAMASLLMEDPRQVFNAWEKALGRGNGGIIWRGRHGLTAGLRTTSGNRPFFSISKNPRADRIGAYIFARRDEQHDGTARVECLGWCERYEVAGRRHDRGHYFSVNADALRRDGILRPLADLRAVLNGEGV